MSLGSHVQGTLTENQFRFIFVFVTEFSGEELELFKTRVLERFTVTPIPVEWRFFPFSELKKKFGLIEKEAEQLIAPERGERAL